MRLQSAGATTSPSVKRRAGRGRGSYTHDIHSSAIAASDSCVAASAMCRTNALMHVSLRGTYKTSSFSSLMFELSRFVRPFAPNNRSARRDLGYTIGPSPRRSRCVTNKLFIVETAIDVLHAFRSTSFIGPCCAPLSPTSVLLDSANSIRLEPPVSATRFVFAFCNSSGGRSVAQMSATFRMSRVACA